MKERWGRGRKGESGGGKSLKKGWGNRGLGEVRK